MNAKIVAFIFAVVACICLCQAAHPQALCMEPLDEGMCRGDFQMYGYVFESNSCVRFNYGGCMGNDNLFETLEECQKACVL